jgi:hypothetical protein
MADAELLSPNLLRSFERLVIPEHGIDPTEKPIIVAALSQHELLI